MKIAFAHYRFFYKDKEVATYSRCMIRELEALGHEVIELDKTRLQNDNDYKQFDLLIDVDCGRNLEGKYDWHLVEPIPIPSIVYLIDSHGKPDIHSKVARRADHVFFAVWNKRDLFADHQSAHWAPNFTDLEYFDKEKYKDIEPQYDFGFFGSKGGLNRADAMIDLAKKNNWTYDVRQVNKKGKHQWPATAEAMANCKVLWNHGQKHDCPNLRVIESMAMGRVLINPDDVRSGMGHLFEPWQDYIPYTPYTCEHLLERMKFAISRSDACEQISNNAYKKVIHNHLTKHRIKQIMEVING